jgi:hypothetical protein
MNNKIKITLLFLMVFFTGIVIGVFVGLPIDKFGSNSDKTEYEMAVSILDPIIFNTSKYLKTIDESNDNYYVASQISEQAKSALDKLKASPIDSKEVIDENIKKEISMLLFVYLEFCSDAHSSQLDTIDLELLNEWLYQ